jgi:hypothetical protein
LTPGAALATHGLGEERVERAASHAVGQRSEPLSYLGWGSLMKDEEVREGLHTGPRSGEFHKAEQDLCRGFRVT